MHTLKGLARSVSQAQVCERKRGRSHGPIAANQVGAGILVTAETLPQARQSRFYVDIDIDPETGEPYERPHKPLKL